MRRRNERKAGRPKAFLDLLQTQSLEPRDPVVLVDRCSPLVDDANIEQDVNVAHPSYPDPQPLGQFLGSDSAFPVNMDDQIGEASSPFDVFGHFCDRLDVNVQEPQAGQLSIQDGIETAQRISDIHNRSRSEPWLCTTSGCGALPSALKSIPSS